MKCRLCEICKCSVSTSLYLKGRGEGVSVEDGETPLICTAWVSGGGVSVTLGDKSLPYGNLQASGGGGGGGGIVDIFGT